MGFLMALDCDYAIAKLLLTQKRYGFKVEMLFIGVISILARPPTLQRPPRRANAITLFVCGIESLESLKQSASRQSLSTTNLANVFINRIYSRR